MSLFSLFQQQPTAPSPAIPAAGSTAPVNGGQPNTPPSVAQNPTVPSAANSPQQVATNPDGSTNHAATASPLANFQDLWKNDPNAPKPAEPFSFNSDPQKLLEAAKSVEFTKALTPELQKRIQAGGADAQQAVLEAMNMTAQMTFAQAAHASAKITENAVHTMEQRFRDSIPDLIKQHTAKDTLRSTNPLMSNPAMAPMIEALQAQFTRKFPTATVQDINTYVNDYLNGAADAITSQRPQAPSKTPVRSEQDWEKYFQQ